MLKKLMNHEIILDNFDKKYWEQCAKKFADYNIYQTLPYQQIRAGRSLCGIRRFIVLNDCKNPVVMANVRIKSLFNFRVGYIQSGPILRKKGSSYKNFQDAIYMLKQKLMTYLKLDVLRVNLNIWDDSEEIITCFKRNGFEIGKYYKVNRTFIVDLQLPEDILFKQIYRDNRRLIRKANKLGLDIVISTNADYFSSLSQMYSDAKKRKGFIGVDPNLFWEAQKKLSQDERLELLVIKYEGLPISIHVTSHLGEIAVPVLTVNNLKSLELNVSNYLWWQAYLRAKKQGMKFYDMGGYDKDKNPKGFLFKKRMGGEAKTFMPPFDYCKNKIIRHLWLLVSKKYYSS